MVDILAPGEDNVVTTMKGNSMTVSGTSYSVAYVSAAVAQIWQQNPGKTSHQIIELLMDHWGRGPLGTVFSGFLSVTGGSSEVGQMRP